MLPMKLRKILFINILSIIFASCAYAAPSIIFYFSPHCTHCIKVKQTIVPELKRLYGDGLSLELRDTTQHEVLQEFMALCSRYHVDAYVPAFYVQVSNEEEYLYIGEDNIENNIFTLLAERLHSQTTDRAIRSKEPISKEGSQSTRQKLIDRFKTFSVWAVIGAGLIDGINPCAFAVIILFISFLTVYGYNRSQIVVIGTFYIVAVFLSYLLIGLGVFNFLYTLSFFHIINRSFYMAIIGLCFILGSLSLYDYYSYRKTGGAEGMFLQLPQSIKKRIQRIFSLEYRKNTQAHFIKLAFGAFLVGGMVSVLEAVCTGQIYVPVIAVIVKNPVLRVKALWFLIVYNLMFVLPLIGIFLLTICGVGSIRLNTFFKSNLGLLKILLSLLFFGLGFFILFTAVL